MNRIEAEDFVYKSYLKAEKYQKYNDKDSLKRKPELSRKILQEMSVTPSVVITGSKGKGSVANMLSQILQTKLKVGLMTSPHIIDFCERFKINGVNISDDDFIKHIEKIAPLFQKIDDRLPNNMCISPMAIQAAIGLSYFNEQHTDFNIFECGKGAKYDDVNNVIHDYAIINSIFLEHTRELGETKEKIATDKVHVITGEQKCVYIAKQDDSVYEIIKSRAFETCTPIKVYGFDFYSKNIKYTNAGMVFDIVIGDESIKNIQVPLLGEHQARNCAIAMAIAKDILVNLDLSSIKKKLSEIKWPGRMEVISQEPFILLDACINRESCVNVKKVITYLNIRDCTTIVGIPDDKDFAGVVKEMSDISNHIILTKSQNPHYVFSKIQTETLMKEGIKTEWYSTIEEAINRAKNLNSPILILGTTSVVAEVHNLQNNKLIKT